MIRKYKRFSLSFVANVTINVPADTKITKKLLTQFLPDKVLDVKLKDVFPYVNHEYAVYYHPRRKQLLQLVHREEKDGMDFAAVNGTELEFNRSIVPDLYNVTSEEEQKLAANAQLSVIDPEYCGDMKTACGLVHADNLIQWIGFDGKLPGIGMRETLDEVCKMNKLPKNNWILIAHGDQVG